MSLSSSWFTETAFWPFLVSERYVYIIFGPISVIWSAESFSFGSLCRFFYYYSCSLTKDIPYWNQKNVNKVCFSKSVQWISETPWMLGYWWRHQMKAISLHYREFFLLSSKFPEQIDWSRNTASRTKTLFIASENCICSVSLLLSC